MKNNRNRLFIIGIFILVLFVRFYQLDSLPAEMWGDSIEHFKMAREIMQGNFFIGYQFGGDGPMLSYFIAIVSKIFGLSFYSLKLTTVLIGTLVVFTTYFLSQELFKNKSIGLLSGYLTAVGFWSISFSRQTKSYILVALFISLGLYFILKKRKIMAGVILGLGMYTQTAFWGGFFLSLFSPIIFIISIVISLPVWKEIFINKNFVFSGSSYLGEKFSPISQQPILSYLSILLKNLFKNLISFNFQGDHGFRHTISNMPHLDFITGLFFILGFALLLYRIIKNNKVNYFFYLIVPFFIIQIPSILDTANSQSSPNMGRMIGVMPLVYIFSAYGIYSLTMIIKSNLVKKSYLFVVLTTIFISNFYLYFFIYPKGLPNKNIPFGKIIAQNIDKYDDSYQPVVVDCCWGEWGQPEPKAIEFQLKTNKKILFFEADDYQKKFSCNELKKRTEKKKIILIHDFKNALIKKEIKNCLSVIGRKEISKNGYQIAEIIEGVISYR